MGASAVYDRFSQLADVATAAPADGQVPTWVASTSRWTPQTPAGGGGGGGTPGGSSGQLQYDNAGAFGGTAAGVYATSGSLFTFTAQAVTDTPLVIVGAAGQTAPLCKVQTNDGTGYVSVAADASPTFWNNSVGTLALMINAANNAGFYLYNNGTLRWSFLSSDGTFQVQDGGGNGFNVAQFSHRFLINAAAGSIAAQFAVNAGDPAVTGMVVRAAAGQTANLVEWQDSAGTWHAAVGPGGGLLLGDLSSTTQRKQGSVLASWATSTDASRKGRLTVSATDYGGDREGLRVEGDGAQTRLSFFGGSAAAKPAVTGSRGGNAALASLLSALAALGLVTDSTTA